MLGRLLLIELCHLVVEDNVASLCVDSDWSVAVHVVSDDVA